MNQNKFNDLDLLCNFLLNCAHFRTTSQTLKHTLIYDQCYKELNDNFDKLSVRQIGLMNWASSRLLYNTPRVRTFIYRSMNYYIDHIDTIEDKIALNHVLLALNSFPQFQKDENPELYNVYELAYNERLKQLSSNK